jgi:hypothetical protein
MNVMLVKVIFTVAMAAAGTLGVFIADKICGFPPDYGTVFIIGVISYWAGLKGVPKEVYYMFGDRL